MSISEKEYVKTLEELTHAGKQEEFHALYPAVEKLLKAEEAYDGLVRIYVLRAAMYFQVSNIEKLVQFVTENLTFFQKYANEEEHLRFKNIRAIALEMVGYREGFYEQMLEMKTYGEKNDKLDLVITALINIGLLKMKNKEYEQALHYFYEARKLAGTQPNTPMFNDYCLATNNILYTYLLMERYDEAKTYLHLEKQFERVYPRYKTFYEINTAKYYVFTNQIQQARTHIQRLRAYVNADEKHAVYHEDVLQCELALAKKIGDLQYEKDIYLQLIASQKKNNNDRLLQQMLQSAYVSKRHELIEVAQCDPLTQLLNRRGFLQQVEQQKRNNKARFLACAMVDIDHFKRVNDEAGHLAGDDLIRHVANILKRFEAEGYVCARYGGDEFVVTFLSDDEAHIHHVIETIFQQLHEPFHYEGKAIDVTYTVGAMYVLKNDTCPVEKLLASADQAMYDVKRNGRAYYAVRTFCEVEDVHEAANKYTV
ncbi:MAG: GGDEF domain-containing protein [Caryophanon sp.]|nr:GGDEF domain-containing protein [Caryophanon sp.]